MNLVCSRGEECSDILHLLFHCVFCVVYLGMYCLKYSSDSDYVLLFVHTVDFLFIIYFYQQMHTHTHVCVCVHLLIRINNKQKIHGMYKK